jgi:glycosyltransferase involved in cell wall biosynthesis
MAQVLLTVSGTIAPNTDEQVACGARPRADYLELAHACDADLIDYAAARRSGGWIVRLLERAGWRDLELVWACFRRRGDYAVIFTDGEQVGIPLALLCKYFGWASRRPYHLMITHVISIPKKMLFFDWLGVQSHIDRLLVYSTWQKRFIETRWQLPPGRVIFTPFMVDTRFFAPEQVSAQPSTKPQICSAGLEARDYPTLLRAVRDLNVQVTIAAASPWSKRADTTQGEAIPANVTVQRFGQFELRQLYADSRFVVMPLYNVTFQAGVTTILEAMAMERAVICTRTPGQIDVIIDGETGLYVPPGDPQALRTAITYLLDHPEEAERMGRAGRQRVEQGMTIEHYVDHLSSYVKMYASSAPGVGLVRR